MNAPQGMIYFIISNQDPIGIPQGFRSSLLFSNWEEKFAGNPIPQPVNKVRWAYVALPRISFFILPSSFLLYWDKILTKTNIFTYKLIASIFKYHNLNKEFLSKNASQKNFPKKNSPKILHTTKKFQTASPKRFWKYPKNCSGTTKEVFRQESFTVYPHSKHLFGIWTLATKN